VTSKGPRKRPRHLPLGSAWRLCQTGASQYAYLHATYGYLTTNEEDLYLPLDQLIKVASPAFGHVPVPPSSLVASSSLPRPFSSVSSSSSSLPYSSELYSSARTLSSPIPSSSVPSSSSGPSSSSTIPCSSPIPSLCDTAFLAANRRYHVSRDEQLNCLPSLVPVLIPNSRTAVNIIFYNHLGRRYCRK
jgi:hypothetical protein